MIPELAVLTCGQVDIEVDWEMKCTYSMMMAVLLSDFTTCFIHMYAKKSLAHK